MAPPRKSEIGLLKDVVTLFHEAAGYLATGDSPTAQRARLKLESKGPDDAAFFSNLSCDLEELGSTLEGIADTFTDKDGEVNTAVRTLLTIVQRDYLNEDRQVNIADDSDDSGSEADETHDNPYLPLQKLLIELRHPQFGPSEAEKIVWLCGETKLAKTKSKYRKILLQAIKSAQSLLQPYGKAQAVDISWRLDDRTTVIWDTPLFSDAEKFHQALSDIWECHCFHGDSHRDAIFSFESTPAAKHSCSAGRLYYRTEVQDTFGWKHTKFEFREQEASPKGLAPTLQLKPTTITRGTPGHFCDTLENSVDGDMVQITGATTKLQRGSTTTLPETTFSERLPLTSCFALPEKHSVYNLSPKRRMMLALYLAYAYLHLSGGKWWPYTRRSSVCFPDHIDPEAPPSAFFAASLEPHVHVKQDSDFDFVVQINKDMPSLIAFGRLLLELYVGHQVIWEKVQTELKQCADHAFAAEMTGVINYCLKPSEIRVTSEPYTIRDDERLRQTFIKEVVLPVQYILQYGYKINVQDIFTPPPAGRIAEVVSPRRLRSPQPLSSAAGTQIIPDGFCLHDGDEQPCKIEDESARDAKAYMDLLKECRKTAIYNDLCPGMDEDTDIPPVKVAILDTGALMTASQCNSLYDERIKECRTWLTTRDPKGQEIPIGSSDSDGHGTHGASVLLQATMDTSVDVYVAQIFKGRKEKVVDDEFLDNPTVTRIANAIRHAVKVWKVDIISMSFGFPERVEEIDDALGFARTNGVLMLAAASNCGGSGETSWPARDPQVMCVFATDGIGNMYARNPTAAPDAHNFATLGSCVEGVWPGQEKPVKKSGTSTATPICAGISALVMLAVRRSKEKYIAAAEQSGKSADAVRKKYDSSAKLLGRPGVMSKVFKLMLKDGKRAGGYDYITPWTLFRDDRSSFSTIEAILLACR